VWDTPPLVLNRRSFVEILLFSNIRHNYNETSYSPRLCTGAMQIFFDDGNSFNHLPALDPRGELWPVLLMCNPKRKARAPAVGTFIRLMMMMNSFKYAHTYYWHLITDTKHLFSMRGARCLAVRAFSVRSRKLSNALKGQDGWPKFIISFFGRHVKPLVPAAFAVVSTRSSFKKGCRQAGGLS
jgi:hypothetical protein